jgi:hypothetical protein
MPHTITYTAESDSVSDTDAISIIETVVSWAEGDPSRHFDGVAYDRVNDGMRLSVRLTGVTEIDTRLSDLDSGLQSINSSEGTSFPPASDTADIRPEQG